jgi:hypothetical protein
MEKYEDYRFWRRVSIAALLGVIATGIVLLVLTASWHHQAAANDRASDAAKALVVKQSTGRLTKLTGIQRFPDHDVVAVEMEYRDFIGELQVYKTSFTMEANMAGSDRDTIPYRYNLIVYADGQVAAGTVTHASSRYWSWLVGFLIVFFGGMIVNGLGTNAGKFDQKMLDWERRQEAAKKKAERQEAIGLDPEPSPELLALQRLREEIAEGLPDESAQKAGFLRQVDDLIANEARPLTKAEGNIAYMLLQHQARQVQDAQAAKAGDEALEGMAASDREIVAAQAQTEQAQA